MKFTAHYLKSYKRVSAKSVHKRLRKLHFNGIISRDLGYKNGKCSRTHRTQRFEVKHNRRRNMWNWTLYVMKISIFFIIFYPSKLQFVYKRLLNSSHWSYKNGTYAMKLHTKNVLPKFQISFFGCATDKKVDGIDYVSFEKAVCGISTCHT